MADPTHEQILSAFRTQVLAATAVQEKIGSRLYLADAGEKPSVPYAVYSVDSSTIPSSHSGQSGVQVLDVSVELFAATATKALQLRDAIVTAIKDFSGLVGATFLNLVKFEGQTDYRDAKSKLFGYVLDFTIHA